MDKLKKLNLLPHKFNNQKGETLPILILVSLLGVMIFVVIASSGSFQNKLFGSLFPKDPSFASSSDALVNTSADSSGPVTPNDSPEIVTSQLPPVSTNKYYAFDVVVKDNNPLDVISETMSGLPEGLADGGCMVSETNSSPTEWICSINGLYVGSETGDLRVNVTVNDNHGAPNSAVSKQFILTVK